MKACQVDPLKCEQCCEPMKIIAYINDVTSINKMLTHLGKNSECPKMQTARGPPDQYCYEESDVAVAYELYDQTISW